MELIIYGLLSSIFFFLGMKCNNERALKLFLFIIFVFPFTNLNTYWHIVFQVPIFLFFMLGGLVKSRYGKVTLRINDYYLILSLIAFFLFIVSTLGLAMDHSLINIFKDLKFVIFGTALYFFTKLNDKISLDIHFMNKMIKWNFYLSLVFYVLMYKFHIQKYVTNDPYFDINEIRYMNYASYVLPFYVMYCLSNRIKVKPVHWVFILVPLLISGNRTVFVITALTVFMFFLRNLSLKKILAIFSSIVLFLTMVGVYFQNLSEQSALFRFKKLFSTEYIASAINTRLTPFYLAIESFDFVDFLIGKGIGFTYYIPWFHYRKNLDNFNIYLDSLLPTLYGKYGLLFFLPILIFLFFLKVFSDQKTYIYYVPFFALLSFTNSFVYQSYLTLVLFFIFIFKQNTLQKGI